MKVKRRRNTRNLLIAIYFRDKGVCQVCGSKTYEVMGKNDDPLSPTIGHIVPLARGGTYDRSNLQLEHRMCNQAKGAAR